MTTTNAGRRVLKILLDPGTLLTSLLLGNTFVNVAASSVAAAITAEIIPGSLGIGIGVLVMTFLLLVAGEISPKTFARRRNREWIETASHFLGFLLWVMSPLAKLLTHPATVADRLLPGREGSDSYRETELFILMEMARDEGVLGGEAATAIAILELDERHCVSAMVPRNRVVPFMSDWSVERMAEEAALSMHTAYPLVDSATGRMTGLVDVRDLLGTGEFKLRSVPFFPESARLSRVLSDLRASKASIGAVVDEYGDWTGIISVTDVLSRAVFSGSPGAPLPEGVTRSGRGFIVSADLPVDVLSGLLDSEKLAARYAESCGGLLQEVTGRLPGEKETIHYSGFTFRVLEAKGTTLLKIFVEKTEEP
jgi:putative hemolysin